VLAAVCSAHFLIIEKALTFKHLRKDDSSMTSTSALRANAGAPVDVPMRMDARFAAG